MNKHKCLKQPGQPPRNLIAKISVTSRALLRNIYGWQKAIKTKEMTKNLLTSNDCRFTYMLDFILKPGGKLDYQDNVSLSKFKGNPSTSAENRVGNSSVSKRFDQGRKSFCQPHAPVILCAWTKMTSMFVNSYLRYMYCKLCFCEYVQLCSSFIVIHFVSSDMLRTKYNSQTLGCKQKQRRSWLESFKLQLSQEWAGCDVKTN